ncbi:LysR family transcriptional regulator [Herbaspirillum huttiense F1]|jgi:DNA-binding transcriptional LysR family regulator|uniref:LysR family transcriptional regulator n=1 Tax=Herbaspirillum huttiense subsp. lycopersici TaxID=3074428 RepID=A0ABU2ENF8_9BURK|nr:MULTISPECIES: LysR family transcriptional regulator [Herbaspirillum]MBP1315193.1 DNA-binding transcriptional LysR family regulator [Herbaspirillum sp. 1130]MDR6741019.1 DNA-binding transcriptional LysR family regulator [Herbaspirillum sp. 1173]MDR9849699.1 LysR family transcriptional regulator [Herbaspirillum huttiense SE1]MDT0357547.1 LysR family transcriptional regulator [Herbaspirillum huttiense F1]
MKNQAMDYLPRMVIFSRVVELGAFSKAARELGLTSSSVSQHISALEAILGTTLLHRTTRKLSLTEAGQGFYAHCARIVALANEARDATESLHKELVGELRIASSSFMAPEYLVPALDHFIRSHPQLRISIHVSDHNVDLMDHSVDLALRVGKTPGPGDIPLARMGAVLCASPDYLQARAAIRRPEDLLQHQMLFFTPHGPDAVVDLTLTNRAGQCAQLRLGPRITANHARSIRQLAVQGHGIGRFLRSKVQDDLKSGRLVEVLPDWSLEGYCAFITTRHRDAVPAKILACIAQIQDYFARRHPPEDEETAAR